MIKLTIFANFRIDSSERYLRMKDSFLSFKDISSDEWVINVRGKYKKKTLQFLQQYLGEKLYSFELESTKGWLHDTRKMLEKINGDYVLFWIEDHINQVNIEKYDQILAEMKKTNSDHLFYSWFGSSNFLENLRNTSLQNIKTLTINKEIVDKVEKENNSFFYMISAVSISSIYLFRKIIQSNHPFLKRWPKVTPFDFEKRSTDTEFIPFNLSIPNYELFASIDDNLGIKNSSLIDRGEYPDRVLREELLNEEYSPVKLTQTLKEVLPQNIYKLLSKVYIFFKRVFYTLR